jgi:hypothetical protein
VQVRQEKGRYDNGQDNDNSAHRGRASFLLFPGQPQLPDGFPDLAPEQDVDQPFAKEHGHDQGQDDRQQHPERDELEQGPSGYPDPTVS